MQHGHFQKKENERLTASEGVCKDRIHVYWPRLNPLTQPRGSVSRFDMFHIYCSSACMHNFGKGIDK